MRGAGYGVFMGFRLQNPPQILRQRLKNPPGGFLRGKGAAFCQGRKRCGSCTWAGWGSRDPHFWGGRQSWETPPELAGAQRRFWDGFGAPLEVEAKPGGIPEVTLRWL